MPPKKCAALDKKKDDDDGVDEREDGDAPAAVGGETASDRDGGGGAVAGAVVAEEWEGGERGGLDIRAEMEVASRGENVRVGGEVGRSAGAETASSSGVDEDGEAAPAVAMFAVSAVAIVDGCGVAADPAALVVEATGEGEAAAPRLASLRDSRIRAIAGGGGGDASRSAALFGGGEGTGNGGGEDMRERGVVVVDGVLFPEMPGLDRPAAFFWA